MTMKRFTGIQRIIQNTFRKILLVAITFLSISMPVLATNSTAHLQGIFGPLHHWPIIPIAMMLMPDGRVFAYGTNLAGAQGAKMYYVVWDPSWALDRTHLQCYPTSQIPIFSVQVNPLYQLPVRH